jgi:hypothetical protein
MKRSIIAFALVAPLLTSSPSMADNSRSIIQDAYTSLQNCLDSPTFKTFYDISVKQQANSSQPANDLIYFAGTLKAKVAETATGQERFVLKTNLTSCSANAMVRLSKQMNLPYNHHFRKMADKTYLSILRATNGVSRTQDCSVFKNVLIRHLLPR